MTRRYTAPRDVLEEEMRTGKKSGTAVREQKRPSVLVTCCAGINSPNRTSSTRERAPAAPNLV